MNLEKEKRTFFENKIKPALLYIGTIGAILMVIAYIAVVLVMIFGFEVKSFSQSLLFAAVNGVVGFVIMQLLKIQGVDFAKNLDENRPVLTEWYNLNNPKIKQFKSIKSYWITSIIKDVLGKVITIVFTSCALIYIVIEGSNDYSMLLLAVVNLIMFVCFGLLSLVAAYDFYNNEHIPYLKQLIHNSKVKPQEEEQSQNKASLNASNEELEQDLNQTNQEI